MEGSSNETMADGGWRNGNVSPDQRAALDPPTVALVEVAAALAEGKTPALRQRLVAARAAAVPDIWIEELLLQSLLVLGYPLALVAFGVWREITGPASGRGDWGGGGGGGGGGGREEPGHAGWESWAEGGAAVGAGGGRGAQPQLRPNP